MIKNFYWKDDHEIGSFKLCHENNWDYDFYINEVATAFTYGWTEEERQRRFNGAKFIFGGTAHGVGYSNCILQAETIEEAKKEFLEWYRKYLDGRIKALEDSLAKAKEEYSCFLDFLDH